MSGNVEDNPFAPLDGQIVGRWLASNDVTQSSKDTYERGLKAFCQYVRDIGADFDALEAEHVIAFKEYLLNELGLSPATVSVYLAGVRAFYRRAEDDGLRNIARNIKGARVSRDFKKDTLTPAQARALLEAMRGDALSSLRDYAMVNLMLRTGLRDIEVVQADVRDLRTEAGTDVLAVQGKGRQEKDAFVVLTSEAIGPIRAYLGKRPSCSGKDPLFASVARRNPGGRLTTRSVSRIVKDGLRMIGLDSDRYTAHSLRHTAITYSLLGGATEREAQEMARHASITTTMVYGHHINRIRDAAELRIGDVLDEE